MPIKTDEREYRAMAPMKAVEGTGCTVEGYATTYDTPYPLWDGLSEIVDRHAFDDCDLSDVIMQYDHAGMVMARNRNGSLELSSDDHGLLIRAELSGCEQGRQLYEAIKNGLIDRMSFAFIVSDDSYDKETDTRTINSISKVFDVSAVSIPANDATEISARACYNGVIEARQAAERLQREKLKIRLRIERGMK